MTFWLKIQLWDTNVTYENELVNDLEPNKIINENEQINLKFYNPVPPKLDGLRKSN